MMLYCLSSLHKGQCCWLMLYWLSSLCNDQIATLFIEGKSSDYCFACSPQESATTFWQNAKTTFGVKAKLFESVLLIKLQILLLQSLLTIHCYHSLFKNAFSAYIRGDVSYCKSSSTNCKTSLLEKLLDFRIPFRILL